MENLIYNFIIFIIVLFFYLHIMFHHKTSNDLEVFQINNPSKEEFEELCDQRNPLIFNYEHNLNNVFNRSYLLENFSSFDLNVCNLKDNSSNNIYLPLSLKKTNELFLKDKELSYISENNSDFLKETNIEKELKLNNKLLIPRMNALTKYDLLMAPDNSYTKLKYNLSYRNYFYVAEGNVSIKLTIPNNKKYLNIQKDYDNFIFYSDIDLWNITEENKDLNNKIKSLDIELNKGQFIYIPAYWLYSFKFKNNAILCNIEYKPFMNVLAILPDISLSMIQKTNIKIKSTDTIKIDSIDTVKNKYNIE